MAGPLSGLRIVDLTHTLAGPYGTMLLADLGADVVKVEPPAGDAARRLGPYRADDELRAFGGYFQSINRGKRSIVLDLETEEDKNTLLALVAESDALVESFNVGTMERLGVPYERLRGINPRLVYASTRSFGDPRTGPSPYADWLATDPVMQAMAGSLGLTGVADDSTGPRLADIFPATLMTVGLVSALLHSQRTGQGQFVDVSMYDGLLSLCEQVICQHSYSGAVPMVHLDRRRAHEVFPSLDGCVAIAIPRTDVWEQLCEIMERPDLVHDVRFATSEARLQWRTDLHHVLSEWTKRYATSELLELLGGLVPVAPLNSVADVFADEHAHQREMLVSVSHPGCNEPVVLAGQPIKFTGTPAGVTGRAPLLDEHGDQIRCELAAAPMPIDNEFENGLEMI